MKVSNVFVKMHCFMLSYFLCVVVVLTWSIAQAIAHASLAPEPSINDFDGTGTELIDPCDDFYGYVCSTTAQSIRNLIETDIRKQIDNTLRTRQGKWTDGTAIKKYFSFYNKCNAIYSKENVVLKLWADFDEFMQKTNINGKAKVDGVTLAKVAAYFAVNHGYTIFLSFEIGKPYKNEKLFRKSQILTIDVPKLSTNTEKYDPAFVNMFANDIKESMRQAYLAIPGSDEKFVESNVAAAFNIEMELAKAFDFGTKAATLDSVFEMPVREATLKVRGIDWRTFIRTLSQLSGSNIIKKCGYLDDCLLQFKNHNATIKMAAFLGQISPQVFKDYIKIRMMMALKENKLFTKDSESICNALTLNTFPLVKQHLYIIEVYPTVAERNNMKNSARSITNNIVSSVRNMIEKVPWIRNDSKTYAGFTKKLDKMRQIVGFPTFLTNQTWLDKHYESYNFGDVSTFSALYLKAHKLMAKTKLEYRSDKLIDYTEANAKYEYHLNKLFLPIATLHNKFYSPSDNAAVRYGGLGAVIAREVMRGFDPTGINFNENGFVRPWISKKSKERFDSMAQCVINDYNSFEVSDSNGNIYHVNGEQTADENIADLGGTQAAYNAFKTFSGSKQPIPTTFQSRNITHDKLFFTSFAKLFCDAHTTNKNVVEVLLNQQTPHNYRIFGTLRNFVPFREAFTCPTNSKYAPTKYCDVYTVSTPVTVPTSNTSSLSTPAPVFKNSTHEPFLTASMVPSTTQKTKASPKPTMASSSANSSTVQLTTLSIPSISLIVSTTPTSPTPSKSTPASASRHPSVKKFLSISTTSTTQSPTTYLKVPTESTLGTPAIPHFESSLKPSPVSTSTIKTSRQTHAPFSKKLPKFIIPRTSSTLKPTTPTTSNITVTPSNLTVSSSSDVVTEIGATLKPLTNSFSVNFPTFTIITMLVYSCFL